MVALLHAAASSPTAVHRRASCLTLLRAAWAGAAGGTRRPKTDDLAGLVSAVEAADDFLRRSQDCVPHAPLALARRVAEHRVIAPEQRSSIRLAPAARRRPCRP